MKIIQIVAAYKPAYIYGGPTMSVSKLCEALVDEERPNTKDQGPKSKAQETRSNEQGDARDAKLEIEVFTTTANGKQELKVKANESTAVDGVKVTYFKRITKDHTHFSPALLKVLRKEILRNTQHNRQLVIHIHAWWNLVSIFSCSLAKWYNIPVILSPRGMLTAYTSGNRNSGMKGIIHKVIGKRLLAYCHIHATSEKEKEDVLAFIQPKSITVIPNMVELPTIEERMTINQNRKNTIVDQTSIFQMIFLSRVEEKKGLELLFDALAKLPFNWQLTIAGTGEENYIESLKLKAEGLKISSQITWLGHVNNEQKFQLMADHDLLVLTSYNENFANVVIESLSVGTPVLLSDQVGLADYVAKNNLGWVTSLEKNHIMEKINQAYQNIRNNTEIRAIAIENIRSDFAEDRLIEKYIQLYKTVIHE